MAACAWQLVELGVGLLTRQAGGTLDKQKYSANN
jgi:hypothetical protein